MVGARTIFMQSCASRSTRSRLIFDVTKLLEVSVNLPTCKRYEHAFLDAPGAREGCCRSSRAIVEWEPPRRGFVQRQCPTFMNRLFLS